MVRGGEHIAATSNQAPRFSAVKITVFFSFQTKPDNIFYEKDRFLHRIIQFLRNEIIFYALRLPLRALIMLNFVEKNKQNFPLFP